MDVEEDPELQAAIQASMADAGHHFPAEAVAPAPAPAAAQEAPGATAAPVDFDDDPELAAAIQASMADAGLAPATSSAARAPPRFEALTVSEQIDHQRLEYLESVEADKHKDFEKIEREAKLAAQEYDRQQEEARLRAIREEEERQAEMMRIVEENEAKAREKRIQDSIRQQQQESDNITEKKLKRACREIKNDVEGLDASETIKLRFKGQAGGSVDGTFGLEMSTKALYDWADMYCCAEKDRMDLIGGYVLKTQSILGSKAVIVDRSGCDMISESGLKKGDVLVMDTTARSGTKRDAMS